MVESASRRVGDPVVLEHGLARSSTQLSLILKLVSPD
jgi:hypothetical protein